MRSLFVTVLNMSFTASYTAVAVLGVRLLLRKAPKVFSYALWGIVIFRLLCPFSLESPLSLVPAKPIISQDIVFYQNPGIESIDSTVNQSIQSSLPAVEPAASVNPMAIVMEIGAAIWLIGIVVLFFYSIVSYCRLKDRLSTATLVKDNIFETDQIQTPFVLGFLKPRIFLPTGLNPEELDYILRHEEAHIKRGDHIVKAVAFVATVLHWFNPLIWLSFYFMSKDMEMSCDEMVLRQSGGDIRAHYSQSLLSLAVKQSGLLTPLAFGESNVKSRIKNVLNYKKPTLWITAVAIGVVALIAVGLIANPLEGSGPLAVAEEFLQYKTKYVGDAAKVGNIIYLLDYPEGIDYDHFALHTVSPSYGVTVYLQTDPETSENYTDGGVGQAIFARNAVIMFSLIENVDYINFNLTDGQNDVLLRYSRDEVDDTIGKDVRDFAQGEEEFAQLLAILNDLETDGSSSTSNVGGVDRAPIVFSNGNDLPKQYRRQFSDYMVDRFTSEYSKYYQVKGFEVSNLEYTASDTGIEITFFFKMIFQNYYKDPDTVPYIREAKENNSPHYEQLYEEYNQPKEGNYDLKFTAKIKTGVIDVNSIELFINQHPRGVDYVPLKDLV